MTAFPQDQSLTHWDILMKMGLLSTPIEWPAAGGGQLIFEVENPR
jgi:hypothetical protein